MTILVDIDFLNQYYPGKAKGFTVSVYSKQTLSVTNSSGGKTNIIHMDG